MWTFLRSLLGTAPSSAPHAERRRGERFDVESVTSNIGDVADLSGFGARIRCKDDVRYSVGQVIQLTLRSSHGSIPVTAEVVRVVRLGRRMDIAIEFLALKPAQRAKLHDLARLSSRRRAAG